MASINRNRDLCMFCRMSKIKCKNVEGLADESNEGKCQHCLKRGLKCGPREDVRQLTGWLMQQPSRLQMSRLPHNTPATYNVATNQDMTSSMDDFHRGGETMAPVQPDPLSVDSNGFPEGNSDLYPDHGNGSLHLSQPDEFFYHDIDMQVLNQEDVRLTPSVLLRAVKLFDLFDLCCAVRAHIEAQARPFPQRDSVHEDWVKTRQSHVMEQVLQEADNVDNADHKRLIYFRLMVALENVGDLGSWKNESPIKKIIGFHESAGVQEAAAIRLRKLVCRGYPNQLTKEQNIRILFPRNLPTEAEDALPQPHELEEHYPILHQLIDFGTLNTWDLFRDIDQLPSKPRHFDNSDQSLVHAASKKGCVVLLQILLDQGLDIHARDMYGRTPALIAASNGQKKALDFLLSRGAEKYIRDRDGNTLLKAAAMGGHVDIISGLKDIEYDFTEKPLRGTTPLILAAENGHYDAVHALLINGMESLLPYKGLKGTAEDVARNNKHPWLAELLKSWPLQGSVEARRTFNT